MNAHADFKRIAPVVPVIKADELAYVAFERKDVATMTRFLTDFGFILLEGTPGSSLFFRTHGPTHYCVEIVPSARDHFIGAGFIAAKEADLDTLSTASGCPVETITDAPGGGKRVRLTDPDGSRVDVIFGFTPNTPRDARRELLVANTPQVKKRVDAEVRTEMGPTPIFRVGHFVLFTPDFKACVDWYQKWLGFLPTDVLTDAEGNPVGGFWRLNRGDKPADHHNLAIFASDHSGVHHISTETLDVDAIGQGQQYLRHKGWNHYWGIGRHLLGSQFFDYWLDPTGSGLEWEHYADGDVMTDKYETGYYVVSRRELWAWGDDLPDVTKPPPGAVDSAPPHLKGLMVEWDKPARPWLP